MKLLNKEAISFTKHFDSKKSQLNDDEINSKYLKGEVRIVTEQARYPLSSIKSMLESGDYDLNPEFQRRHRWSIPQKSRLIESFIMNVPIPPIFLYEDTYSHYEVMDGLQRLTAIKEFYNNEFALENLEEWPELNDKRYIDLPFQIRKGIDRRYLSSIILLHETAKNDIEALKLKQLVFERINSGGVQLEAQESRNAVYNGPFNELCIRLARDKFFCAMWEIPAKPSYDEIKNNKQIPEDLLKHPLFSNMGDVELVLRFFANRQRQELIKFTKSFKEYLNLYLKEANFFESELLFELEKIFLDTIKLSYDIFGKNAFSLFRERKKKWSWYKRPTTAVYDPMTNALSMFLEHSEALIEKKDNIKKDLENFYKTNYEKFGGRNTNPGIVKDREELFIDFFKSYIK